MRGPETERSHIKRMDTGFYFKYMSGKGLDIGFRGSLPNAEPVLPSATGIDTDFPGYDGKNLPFSDESQDYVFASHVLEHISDPIQAIKEWFRVLKIYGHLVICVPHQYLYEKKKELPSFWNSDHKRFYTPALLIQEIESALNIPNTWRLRLLKDHDEGYNYLIPPEKHAGGPYEIECVVQKIVKPEWELK